MNEKAKTKEFIFKRILDEQKQLSFYGVKNIGLFGSFLRGDQTPLSDIDLLVEFMPQSVARFRLLGDVREDKFKRLLVQLDELA